MKNEHLIKFVSALVVVVVFGWEVSAISNVEQNVQNTITEEERRGAATNANNNDNANSNKKIIVDDAAGDKKTRGIHSTSASHKHQHYFVPSSIGYDSHIAATGHGGGGGGGYNGGGYNGVGTTAGYEYGSHGTGPSSTGGAAHSAHGPHGLSQHHGPTGYAASATGYGFGGGGGGYGFSHGYGHSGHGGHNGIGDHGHGHGQGGGIYGHVGQGGGHGGIHNALALKGLLIPLAGIALLGAAAALSTNPVLLQLGVVNGRRRRRSTRSLPENYKYYPANPRVKPDGAY